MKTSGFVDYILELLAPLGVTTRPLFGGIGLYRQGTILGFIDNDQLYFKTGSDTVGDYEKAGSSPFMYESRGRKIPMSYWTVPPELLDDQDALCSWAEKAYKVSCMTKRPARKSNTQQRRKAKAEV